MVLGDYIAMPLTLYTIHQRSKRMPSALQSPLGRAKDNNIFTHKLYPNRIYRCNNDDIVTESFRINNRTGECMEGFTPAKTTKKRRIKR